jgi:hypothetical protein
MGLITNAHNTSVKEPKWKIFIDLGEDGRMILKCILVKQDEKMWPTLFCLRTRTSGRLLCEG